MNYELLWCIINHVYIFYYDWCEANPQWFVVDCLPICMNVKTTCRISLVSLLGEYSRIAGATSVGVLDRLWSRTVSLCCFWIYFYRWDLLICRDLIIILCGYIYELMTWLLEVYDIYIYISDVMFLIVEILYMSIVNYSKMWRLFLKYLLYLRDLSL